MKISSELKSLNKLWKKSEAKAQTDHVPDGSYQVRITENKIGRSKNERMQIKTVLRILTGPYKNRPIYKYTGMETENNMAWLKMDLKKLGIKLPKNLMHLPELLEGTIDMIINVTIKTNGAFINVYYNDIVEELDNIDEDEDDEDLEDDDDTEEEDDDEDEDEDDEEEEEVKPKKKKKKKKKKVKKSKKKKKVYEEEDDDELDDEDDDEEDDDEDEEDED